MHDKIGRLPNSLYVALVLFVTMLSWLFDLVTEIRFINQPSHWIYWTSLLTCLAWGLWFYWPEKWQNLAKQMTKIFFWLGLFLFIIQSGLRLVDIYHLNTYVIIEKICAEQSIFCTQVSQIFFNFKLYRIITLSSIFFIKLLSSLVGIWLILTFRSNVKKMKLSVVQGIFFFMLLVGGLANLEVTLAEAHFNLVQSLQVLPLSSSERFVVKMGGLSYDGWIQPYADFVIKHTKEDSVILIPPRESTWAMVGNEAYFRWFVYPRKLVQLDAEGQIPPDVTHILIAQGDCRFANCGWPKMTIEQSHIAEMIFIDRQTLQEETITNQSYQFDSAHERWGIIKLKP